MICWSVVVVCLVELVYSGTAFSLSPNEHINRITKNVRCPCQHRFSVDISDHISVASHIVRVSCDGGGGALGHPQVWLNLQKEEDNAPAKLFAHIARACLLLMPDGPGFMRPIC